MTERASIQEESLLVTQRQSKRYFVLLVDNHHCWSNSSTPLDAASAPAHSQQTGHTGRVSVPSCFSVMHQPLQELSERFTRTKQCSKREGIFTFDVNESKSQCMRLHFLPNRTHWILSGQLMLLKSLYIISDFLCRSDAFEIFFSSSGQWKCLNFLFYGGYILYRKCCFHYILNSLFVTCLLRLKCWPAVALMKDSRENLWRP